ncbi:MAG TPA: NAD(P)/FAD-dependent oxidoreductase [Gemmatimonadaceae bacterium]
MNADAIIIGAGPNGLVAALALAKRGRKVVVLESADAVGGHTRTIEFAPGFRSPIVEDDGAVLRNVWKLFPAGSPAITRRTRATAMSVRTDGGSLLTLPAWSNDANNPLAVHSKRDAERWPRWLKRFAGFKSVMERLYQLAPPDIDTTSIGDVLSLAAVGLRTRMLGRADMIEFLRVMPMSVQDLVDDEFESEPLKAAIASAAVRDLRQGPRSGGTVFNLVHHMVGGTGLRSRYTPPAPDAFCVAAADLIRQSGGEVRIGAEVARITVRGGAATGVALWNGDEISAPIVISTADPKRTLLTLVEPQWLDPEIGLAVSNIKLRGCTAVVMYALDAAPPQLFESPVSTTATTVALEKAADAAKYGEVSADVHVECWSPSLRWPSLAPAGKHVLVARMQYAPYALKSGAWGKAEAASLEKKVTAAVSRVIPGFAGTVQHSLVLTPKDIETRFGVSEGALTHGEIMLDQIMFMRPIPGWGRYAMPIRGLFLGGAGAHPGPGILGGAGLLAAKAALK